MAHYSIDQLSSSQSISEKADVVLVGAGVSSLYMAWQMLKKDANLNIVILEQLDRIGGRLDSDVIHFKDGSDVKEEEGGMRFTFDTMEYLMAMIQELGIDDNIVPFPMNSGGNNRLYFRGKAFTNKESTADNYSIWSDLYHLNQVEEGINPKTIIDTVFNRILDVNPDFKERPKHRDPQFWQNFRLQCQWKGVRLIDWQLQGLLSDMGYSTECINLLYRLSGFNGTFLSNMNAGVAYQLLEDFPSDPKFKTFKEGFSTLTNGMVDAINAIRWKGLKVDRIKLKTMVDRIDFVNQNGDEEKELVLHYTNIDKDGKTINGQITAGKVILGLPRLALERLFVQSNVFNKLETKASGELWNTLQSTSNQPLLKINLYYDKAWWGTNISGQPPVDFGPNFSDLPLGSVYPFYSVNEEISVALEYAKWLKDNDLSIPKALQTVLDSKHQKPAALTIYCDYMNINYWKALQNQGINYPAAMQAANPKLQAASTAVVEQATNYFKKLFNTHYVPEPVLTSARIWSGSVFSPNAEANADKNMQYQPYGYGVHMWAMGAEDDKVMADLVKPIEGIQLYTCGEAYSDFQGWVEGALRSANKILKHEDFCMPTILDEFKAHHKNDIDPADPHPANTRIKEIYWRNYVKMIRKEANRLDFKVNEDLTIANNPYLEATGENEISNTKINGKASSELAMGVDLTYFDK